MISASLDAWLRLSSSIQPKLRIMIRYRRRRDTNRRWQPCVESEAVQEVSDREVARCFRVSRMSANRVAGGGRWLLVTGRRWRRRALVVAGASSPRLSCQLQAVLEAGPAAA